MGSPRKNSRIRPGFNRNYVGMVEREENAPTVDTLEALAKALKIEPDQLLKRSR